MRTTKILSITLPPGMHQDVLRIAKEENRTISELVREALRRYQQEQRWEKIHAIGSERARTLGISEEDVVPVIRKFRREQRIAKKAAK